MLDEAIVDAGKLKESAMKSAEQIVIEKYSKEFKSILNELLEQEEIPDLGEFGDAKEMEPEIGLTDPTMDDLGDVTGEVSEEITTQIPTAGSDPIEEMAMDEEIEIDFSELERQFQNPDGPLSSGIKLNVGNPAAQAAPVAMEEEYDIDALLEQELENLTVDESDEELEEEVNFDYEVVPTGHSGAPTDKEYRDAQEIMKIKKNLKQLQEQNEKLLKQNKEYKKHNKKQKDVIVQLSAHVTKTNLANAKLLFTNKVLGSNSLNERQKSAIVQKIASAKNVEEAKIIYETLKSTVGELQKRKAPQSLSEAVSVNSILSLPSSRQEEKVDLNQEINKRWKKLAGI